MNEISYSGGIPEKLRNEDVENSHQNFSVPREKCVDSAETPLYIANEALAGAVPKRMILSFSRFTKALKSEWGSISVIKSRW